MRSKIRLGEILVLEKRITVDQLTEILRGKGNSRIGVVLVEKDYVTPEEVSRALDIQQGLMMLDLQRCDIKEECVKRLPEKLSRKNNILAIDFLEDNLIIAMADPLDIFAIDEIELFIKTPYKVVRADTEQIKNIVNKYYAGDNTRKVLEEFNEVSGDYLVDDMDD